MTLRRIFLPREVFCGAENVPNWLCSRNSAGESGRFQSHYNRLAGGGDIPFTTSSPLSNPLYRSLALRLTIRIEQFWGRHCF